MDKFKLLDYRTHERNIHLPNEIFEDLHNAIPSAKHVAFAYSYYYLINYLYRHTKYTLHNKITQSVIKEILCHAPTYKYIDYIIKKDGVLDQIGYTQTTTNYPISHTLDRNNTPEFLLLDEFKSDNKDEMSILNMNDRNFKIKFPVKAFFRNSISMYNDYYDGTFYEPENTHHIPVHDFIRAMSIPSINTVGFYIYATIRRGIVLFDNWLAISKEKMTALTGISYSTIDEYIDELVRHGFLNVDKKNYFNNPERHANVYTLPKNSPK